MMVDTVLPWVIYNNNQNWLYDTVLLPLIFVLNVGFKFTNLYMDHRCDWAGHICMYKNVTSYSRKGT